MACWSTKRRCSGQHMRLKVQQESHSPLHQLHMQDCYMRHILPKKASGSTLPRLGSRTTLSLPRLSHQDRMVPSMLQHSKAGQRPLRQSMTRQQPQKAAQQVSQAAHSTAELPPPGVSSDSVAPPSGLCTSVNSGSAEEVPRIKLGTAGNCRAARQQGSATCEHMPAHQGSTWRPGSAINLNSTSSAA